MTAFTTTTHLSIRRENALAQGNNLPVGITVDEVKPDYSLFERLMLCVGAPWRWNQRYTHIHENAFWRTAMNDPATRLFVLRREGEEIGLCLAIRPRSDAAPYLTGVRPVEIKYFGLFLEETGHGYGGPILQELFHRLLQRNDEVYLSTRSTNHEKVVPFYQKNGMRIVGQEVGLDDTLAFTSCSELKKAS